MSEIKPKIRRQNNDHVNYLNLDKKDEYQNNTCYKRLPIEMNFLNKLKRIKNHQFSQRLSLPCKILYKLLYIYN
jgi:hypothetical protein